MYRRTLPLLLIVLAVLPLTIQSAAPSSLLIIQNTGQYHPDVRYLVLGSPGTLWLTENSFWLTLPAETGQTSLHLTFPGANLHPGLEPFHPLSTNISYYQGSNLADWHERVPVFGSVRYTNLYPGVDLEITGKNGQIALHASAALEMKISGGDATPRALTLQPGHPTPLQQVLSPTHAGDTMPARLTNPTGSPLLFGTFLGSNGLDEAQAIATDGLGRIYLAGQMLPIPPPFGPEAQPLHAVEAFLARFTPDGSGVEYLTIILGDVEDWGKGLAVDAQYQAYFAGETDSTNFPTTPGAYDTTFNGSFDAFLMKIGADGTVVYSTLLGHDGWDTATAVTRDGLGNAYVTGDTWSPDFPTTSDTFDNTLDGPRDAFIAKFNADGSQLLYSTFIGGENVERAEAIALTGTDIVVIGWTSSSDFPTTLNAYDITYNNAVDAFALKLTLGSSTLTYGTYLGGSGEDRGYTLVLDGADRVFIAGVTASGNFPATVGAYDTTYAGGPPACDGLPCPDAFAARLSANGQTLDYATFLGNTEWDQANGLAVDSNGNVYLTGEVNSSGFPTSPDAYDSTLTGGRDAFLTVLSSSFNTLMYSTFLGGSNYDEGLAIWLGENGGVFLGGTTESSDFPTTAGAYNTTLNGDFDGFAVLLSLTFNPFETPTPTNTPTGTLPTPTPSSTPTITPSPTLTPTPSPTSTPILDQNIYIPFLQRNP